MPNMLGLEITTDQGAVVLRQVRPPEEDYEIILLHPGQVPLVIQWLQTAAEEAKAKQAGGA